jgi:hypothetical protein
MKKLIVSYDTYSWIKYISGMIIEKPGDYEVVIVCEDTDRDMYYYKGLCDDSIYSQRRYDLFRCSKKIGLKKVSNLNYTYSTLQRNLDKFIAELSVMSLLSGVGTIIYQNNYILRNIIESIGKKSRIDTFSYQDSYSFENTKFIYLKNETVDKKISLSKYMIGIHDNQENKLFPSVEQLYH